MNDHPDAGLRSVFSLLAESASTAAQRTDLLFTVMLVLCGTMALVLAGLIVFFSIRYRRGSNADRRDPPTHAGGLEAAWTIAPMLVFIAVFGWSAVEYVRMVRSPANALPVQVVAKQWMWKLEHRNGRREINELHVPLGLPVRLVMTSQDTIHSFYVPAFRLKQDVVPGRYTTLSFTATQLGDFHLLCAEFCGSEHSAMIGRVVVMTPSDYARWLESGPAAPGLAERGFALFRRLGCSGCHSAASTVPAPPLDGLLGREVHLQDGRTLVADESYVRDSILLPKKDVVAGYAPVMPSFAGQVDEDDLAALLAYLRSTGRPGAPSELARP